MARPALRPIPARQAEATFLAADPPRASRLALWSPDGTAVAPPVAGGLSTRRVGSPTSQPVTLVLPSGSRSVRTTTVEATTVALADAVDWLVGLDAGDDVPASLAAWVAAFRLGADLVARGRLFPAATAAGHDTWRVGPLDAGDDARLQSLLAVFPARAHCRAAGRLGGRGPIGVDDPDALIRGAWDGLADALVRTAAAPLVVAAPAFAAPGVTDISADRDWLDTASTGLGATGGARPILRVELPDDGWAVNPEPAPTGGPGAAPERAATPRSRSRGAAGKDKGKGTGGGSSNGDRDEGGADEITVTLQLRSTRDPSLVIDAAELWDAPAAVLARLGSDAETDLLLALRRGRTIWSPLQRCLDQARPESFVVDDGELLDLFGPASADLAAAGFDVLWPSTLTAGGLTARPSISSPTPAAVTESGFTLDALLRFEWVAALDGERLDADELAALAEAKRPLVRLRGRWVVVDPMVLERLRRGGGTVRGADALAAALSGTLTIDDDELDVEVDGALAELAGRLRAVDPSGDHERPEPPGLHAELRPYQRRGLAWLAEMTDLGFGGCLADDMGLGKTIQLIALHLLRHPPLDADADAESLVGDQPGAPRRPTLVVCPTSLLGNWERELHRFAPHIPTRRFHGGDRHLDDLAPDEVVLVTYGVVRRDHEALGEVEWGLVVADEAQHIKNPLARTARSLRTIDADARLALTGTPVENRLSDLWALLDWTTPGLLGPLETFRRTVAIPIERHQDADATERFARLVRPFLLRRRKIDPGIAPDLPAKTETDQIVTLTAEQATLYEAVVRETMAEISEAEGIARRGLVLKLLTGLKQICNHPAQYLHEPGPLTGRSGKLAALDELVDAIVDAGDSVLVFSQYVAMATLLERHLAARDVPSLLLSGKVPAARRQVMVDRFQAGEVPVFLLSLKAGGTGLNLTRATHVIHYDRWWNPAVEDQATDRAYRIGQDRPVQVHRLIAEGTVEDRIATLLASKRSLANAVVGTGEGWIGDLSDADLADLVSLSGGDR